MKSRFFISMVFFAVFFATGCAEKTKEKKAPPPKIYAPVVGTWVGEDYSTNVKTATEQTIRAGKQVTRVTKYIFTGSGTFTEDVAQYQSIGSWEATKDSLIIKYKQKAGPDDRSENRFKIITVNDTLLLLQYNLQGFGTELYTYKRQ